MQRSERTKNQLLAAVSAAGTVTRQSLCESTGFSRSAIAQSVSDLLQSGVLEEVPLDTRPTHRGRPPVALRVVAPRCIVVGIDLHTTRVHVAMGDQNGLIVADKRLEFPVATTPVQAIDLTTRLTRRILAVAGVDTGILGPIVIGIPDTTEWPQLEDGTVATRDWFDRRFAEDLGKAVRIVPSTELGALGEARSGAAAGRSDFLYVRLGDTATSTLMVNGQPFAGAHGLAGRIGHIQLQDHSGWCACGSRGCLDTVISGKQILTQLANTNLRFDECASDVSLIRLSNNPVAARVISEAGRALGKVLADISNFLDPELIVLSGDVGATGRPLVSGVRESIQRHYSGDVDVISTALGGRAEVLGAVAMGAELARMTG